ncbi:hypothetical protein [Pseudosulfitobacter koreensis]|uniref:Uncharacterized protein n=1 Tax=Pseudosulfitobacter koreensis TaxID=2968472 RepID=A0ABT1YZH7_9RHOB|nr:hypothetical protein [Pseudosulfitobacter koreense]MCR8826289.1 hypothetical protein [Pseudosulfitobacter koreense]
MRLFLVTALIAAPLALAACAQFPELDAAISERAKAADYPELVNVAPILARAENDGPAPAVVQGNLEARVAALRSRAARIKGSSVIDSADRTRLAQEPRID